MCCSGGFSWFSDLTVYDPSFVLPGLALALSYAVLEVCWQIVACQGLALFSARSLFAQVGFGRSTSSGPVSGGASLLQGSLIDKTRSFFQMMLIASIPLSIDLPAVRGGVRMCTPAAAV